MDHNPTCHIVVFDPIPILKKHFNNDKKLYNNIPNEFNVGRYHSWVVNNKKTKELIITSVDKSNNIMSFKHKKYKLRGVQYHPESILTDYGKEIIKNWINN